MAKDRRNKTRPTLNIEENSRVSLPSDSHDIRTTSGTTGTPKKTAEEKKPKAKKKPKKKLSHAALIIRCVVAALVLAVVIFLCVLGNYIYQAVFVDDTEKVPSIPATSYDVTPTENKDKVAYYLVGMLGDDDAADMSMLSMVCYDKQKQAVSVMQIPASTYIGDQEEWIVEKIGSIWANPKPYDWCETCRKRVYAPEITEGETATHSVCGTEITKKTGSSFVSLIDAVNTEIGLPVDHYFVLPQKALKILVDSVGGVDINLAEDLTLADTDLAAGVHTLSGAQAMEYAAYSDGTISRDLTRLTRQREVFGALLTRMFRLDTDTLTDDVIEEVMDSSAAIRTDCDTKEIVAIVTAMATANTNNTTVYLAPGESASAGSGEVFSIHSNELVTLLNTAFNPYGTALMTADVTMPELVNTTTADQRAQKLSECVTDQTGKLLESTDGE